MNINIQEELAKYNDSLRNIWKYFDINPDNMDCYVEDLTSIYWYPGVDKTLICHHSYPELDSPEDFEGDFKLYVPHYWNEKSEYILTHVERFRDEYRYVILDKKKKLSE